MRRDVAEDMVGTDQHVADGDAHLARAVPRRVDESHSIELLFVRQGQINADAADVLFREAIHLHQGRLELGFHAGPLQVRAQRLGGHDHPLFIGREYPAVEHVNADLGAGELEHVRQAAEMVDMAVREQDAADVFDAKLLAEIGAHRFQAGHHVLVRLPVAAAGVDERERATVKEEIDIADEVGKNPAGNAIDAFAGARDKPLDGRKLAHALTKCRFYRPELRARHAGRLGPLAEVCVLSP